MTLANMPIWADLGVVFRVLFDSIRVVGLPSNNITLEGVVLLCSSTDGALQRVLKTQRVPMHSGFEVLYFFITRA